MIEGGGVGERYGRERLSEVIGGSSSWAGVMRALELRPSGGRRRALQRQTREYGIDTSHFTRGSPWRAYSDAAISDAVASSTTLREVAAKLGARPATGTLSHLRRRVAAAGIDTGHLPALNRAGTELPFSPDELRTAVRGADSVRALVRGLGLAEDDSASVVALRRALAAHGITFPTSPTRGWLSPRTASGGGRGVRRDRHVLRALGLPVDEVNRRRVRRHVTRLSLDTSHFKRRAWGAAPPEPRRRPADQALRVLPDGSPRPRHERLRRALDQAAVPYRCAGCGNSGVWRDVAMTLQIDHINGDWLDNRRENLRYLCPNCHAITDTCAAESQGRGADPRAELGLA